jgi:hypothetical protein
MIIVIDAKNLGATKFGHIAIPTGKLVPIKNDETFVNSVEERLVQKNNEQKQSFELQ